MTVTRHPLRLLLAAGGMVALAATLAACTGQPPQGPRAPQPTSSTTTPSTDGRIAPTPMNTAPAAPMR
ncbi:MAG: hypothetical protein JWP04_956 [Belnapia sp.]|nr:hypothetical protein [Belnapia sp.]